MVRRIKLSEGTIASVLKDVENSCASGITGDIADAAVFVLIPLDDNQVLLGVDGSLEEVEFGERPLTPKSLVSAAFFVGEGSHFVTGTVDGVSISVRGKHS